MSFLQVDEDAAPMRRRSSLIMNNPKKVKPQLLVGVVGTLGYFCTGAIRGWSSCGVPSLNATRTFDILPSDYPWFSSLPMLGAVMGAIFISFPMESRGRKTALLYEYVSYIIGFLLIGFAYFGRHKAIIYVGRVLTGVGTGMTTPASQIYVSECSSPGIKGRLGSLSASSLAFGILVAYIIGAFIEWNVLSLVFGFLPIFFMVWTSRMPETPTWYLMQGRAEEAKQSLQRLRGRETNVNDELAKISLKVARYKAFSIETKNQKVDYSELFSLPVLKPLFISFVIMFFRQATGINAIICNTVTIFKWTEISSVKPHYATIIVGIIQWVFTVASGFILVPNIGRRRLLMASSFFMSISLATLGIFFYLKNTGGYEDVYMQLGMVPLISLSVFFLAFSCGYANIPFLIMGEMFPSKFRAILGTTSSISNFLFAFVVLRFFGTTVNLLGEDGIWFMFAILTFISIGFVYFFVPETKGKTVEEMEKHFGYHPTYIYIPDDDERLPVCAV